MVVITAVITFVDCGLVGWTFARLWTKAWNLDRFVCSLGLCLILFGLYFLLTRELDTLISIKKEFKKELDCPIIYGYPKVKVTKNDDAVKLLIGGGCLMRIEGTAFELSSRLDGRSQTLTDNSIYILGYKERKKRNGKNLFKSRKNGFNNLLS